MKLKNLNSISFVLKSDGEINIRRSLVWKIEVSWNIGHIVNVKISQSSVNSDIDPLSCSVIPCLPIVEACAVCELAWSELIAPSLAESVLSYRGRSVVSVKDHPNLHLVINSVIDGGHGHVNSADLVLRNSFSDSLSHEFVSFYGELSIGGFV